MPTCLITGNELGPDTREEHTIPRSLGGRIRSRVVSCNEFNQACGDLFDPNLKGQHQLLLSLLAPALAREHDVGRFVTLGGDGRRYVTENGVTQVAGMRPTGFDENARPTGFEGNPTRVTREGERMKRDTGREVQVEFVGFGESHTSQQVELLSTQGEVAGLKCVLLSFDHLLRNQLARRFTRMDALEPLRQYVKSVVIDEGAIKPEFHDGHVLGMQLAKQETLNHLADSLRGELADYERQQFEHVMIASGNTDTGILDAAWHVFGGEWQGFRFATDWHEFDFTCMFVNQVLRHGSVAGSVWQDIGHHLCRPEEYKATHRADVCDEEMQKRVMSMIGVVRRENCKRACLYADMECNEPLATGIAAATACETESNVLSDGLLHHLKRRYDPAWHKRPDFQKALKEASTYFDVYSNIRINDPRYTDHVDWPQVLDAFRGALGVMVDRMGLPGHFFTRSNCSEIQAVERQVPPC